MAKSKDYFDFSWVVSLILAIIPFTSLVLGILTRFNEGNLLAAILRIPLFPIVFILDIVGIFLNQRILRLL